MKIDNFENNLHHAVNNLGIGDSSLLSGYLYIDMDDTGKHFIIKLILAIINDEKNPNNIYIDALILTYTNHDHSVPWNNSDTSEFFTVFFPTLFLFRIRGHISIIFGLKKE